MKINRKKAKLKKYSNIAAFIFVKRFKNISHTLCIFYYVLQSIGIVFRNRVKKHDAPSVQIFGNLTVGMRRPLLIILFPVAVSKAPENIFIPHIACDFQRSFAVFAHGRPEIFHVNAEFLQKNVI